MNLDSKVLSQILLIQNMLRGLKDEKTIFGFSARGLEEMPGTETVSYQTERFSHKPVNKKNIFNFPIYINETHFGEFIFEISDETALSPYIPYIRNLCYMIAVIIEERRQQAIIKKHKENLEKLVQERTREAVKAKELAELYLLVSEAMIVELNNKGDIRRINQRGCQVLGYNSNQLVGKNWFDITIPEDIRPQVKEVFSRLMRKEIEQTEYYENEVLTKTGGTKFISWHNLVVYDETGQPTGTLSSGIDITERKKVENKFKQGLHEKEILLKELYHRTRNNMQVIIGILQLQSATEEGYTQEELIRETTNRIESMSLIHKMLYQSQNLSEIYLNGYIAELAELLFKSYRKDKNKIKFTMELQEILVNIDTASPCGLIINELVSNALKYAFPGDKEGEIILTLEKTEENTIIITVNDDGVGVPDDFDYRNQQSLGMKLIHNITEYQLNGSVEYSRNIGLRCRITFKDENHDTRV